ncbi:hypothetical protein ElyMa_001472100 [Elysia marginata]|uniref:Uncharacterized protein n=1 Tax=Elysia marginata TaxID=1093978 RepID=A0AAV4J3D9_9GAST|nr:hypothetical protein ElyMa_001472100 [Elysia marginata]
MSLTATINGVIYISQFVACAITDPKDYCGHKNYDNQTSNPVILDKSKKLCAERDVYTPPEMAYTFPSANLRVIYTGRTNATITKDNPNITIVGRDDILGNAKGVFYKKKHKGGDQGCASMLSIHISTKAGK